MPFQELQGWELRDRGETLANQVESIPEFDLLFDLCALGDKLARDANINLLGLDALHYELVIRHGWLPSVVRELPHRDLAFAFHAELDALVLPGEYEDWRQKAHQHFWIHNQPRNRQPPDPT